MIRRLFFELCYLLGCTPWDTGVSPPELIQFLNSHPPGRAVDLGCGTGTNLITMARRGWHVTGVDVSRRAVHRAQRKAHAAGFEIEIRHDDVTRLQEVTGPFDLALDIGCYHSLRREGRARYAENVSRLVRPGGTYLLYSWLAQDSRGNGTPTKETILQHFGQNFELATFERGTDRHRTSAWFNFRCKT